MESKEVFGGFVPTEADHVKAAVQIAATNLIVNLCAVELRPLLFFSKPRPTF